jgi:hypothetical protein
MDCAVFVVVLGVLLLNLLVRVQVHRLYLKLQVNKTPWDDAVLAANWSVHRS